ncbi:unnamed protein product [Polarella glacialis]|uniref:Uncharacterized protein n=1 Tax=Polarella glacialis TaxID=89957 RepID=A0A813ES54_POLGL|nr:unnamed protein product [Polarella glacialis]
MPEQQFGRVAICDVASGARRAEFDCSSPVMSLAFVPDNGVVVCGARDGQITIWDLEAQRKRSTLSMPSSVNSLVYDRITKRLIAGDKSGNIRVWTLDEVMSC